jgi:predicted nuclease of predicted toxin-antitoxin system
MKLLIDMNLSPRWIHTFARSGIEALHWSTVGACDAPDSVIMAFAKGNDYIVLTHDLDFSAILAATAGTSPA